MMNLLRDLRYACRVLVKSPIFTLTAVLTLGLGIGANTAMFSVVDALLLRQLPVQEPSRLVLFGHGRAMGSGGVLPSGNVNLFSTPTFRHLQSRNQSFVDMAAMKSIIYSISGRLPAATEMERMRVQMVSGSYFPTLGLAPLSGRLFTDEDDKNPGGHPIAVASYAWWKDHFGEEPVSSGKTVTIISTVYTIVGITPPSFFGTTVGDAPSLWIPLSMDAQVSPGWNGVTDKFFHANHVIARLKPGVTLEKASAEVNTLFTQLLKDYSGPVPTENDLRSIKNTRIQVNPAANGLSRLRGQFSATLQVLFGMVAMVLLIACANLANLLLARAGARSREITIRMAVGAGRGRLIRQLLTESLVLAVLGGLLGMVMATFGVKFLLGIISPGADVPVQASVDLRAFGFTSFICVCAAILFGLVPALRATRLQGNLNLKDGKGSSTDSGRSPLGNALLVGQVAVSLILLAGAGLFMRTLSNLSNTDLGFEKSGALVVSMDMSAAGYKEDSSIVLLHLRIEEQVERIPGVKAASFAFFTFGQGHWTDAVATRERPNNENLQVSHNVVGGSYFTAMGIPLAIGRPFQATDTETSQFVAIVNDSFAREYFPNQSPLGQRFRIAGSENDRRSEREIVGVVRDVKHESIKREAEPMAYYPHSQRPQFLGTFVVRYGGDEASVAAALRKTMAGIDRNIPVTSIRTLRENIDNTLLNQKLSAQISSIFAGLALFLACVGIYGVTSYRVNCQTREIGVRMALGAQRRQIFSLVLGQTFRVLAIGIVIGFLAMLGSQRLIASQLFGVPPTDFLSVSIAAGVIAIAALLAGFIPAGAASRLHPNEALRSE